MSVQESTGAYGKWTIADNKISNFAYHGIAMFGVKDPVIEDNELTMIATDASATYDYIHTDANSSRPQIHRNKLYKHNANTRYGLNILTTSNAVGTLSDNSFFGFGTEALNFASTAKLVSNNESCGVASIEKVKNNALGASGTFTLRAGIDPYIQRVSGTLTGDVTVNFANPRCDGAEFKFLKVTSSPYTLTIDTGAVGTKVVAQNEWIEVTYSQQAGAWLFTCKGTL